jgi:hypothetical protein
VREERRWCGDRTRHVVRHSVVREKGDDDATSMAAVHVVQRCYSAFAIIYNKTFEQ